MTEPMTEPMTETVALVVAAGRGRRFSSPLPKQYVELAGRPVLSYALTRLARNLGRAVPWGR